ncbi:toxin TcdB middle/N-terminal domain-containing protein [Cohnella herbarum]|uniref:Uncharacterized protein n=1 Tax=Cohnella herbarum TaxID=2728023 RepID=A0A7Z2VR67_9BACL|nr:toxin TcdB middle/N-terminal domain-containing protein [Cohnella herbarum]QJD87673.1 hypothetical protein HH215_33805 [Cohnella herbarum]
MDDAPSFDHPDQYNERQLLLADLDGSGVTDIVYMSRDGAALYFNQSGNRWSKPRRISNFPQVDRSASFTAVDLLGNGTACLVWSSPLAGSAHSPLRYMDLMGGQKPNLLIGSVNNLGAETKVHYAPSTKFYLADKSAGNPWHTKLPFPVHVVERVETYDRISGNRFVNRYAYHHGYYDGQEREFRGFGLVEQWDTETLASLGANGAFPAGTNVDEHSHVPPALTRTWYYTGAESDGQSLQMLDDTAIPAEWTEEERREGYRALRGSMLRQAVYALDGTEKQFRPYAVSEQNFTIRMLQPKGGNRHGVFLAHVRESIASQDEREGGEPRISHSLTLAADLYGNVLKSAAIAYGRRAPDPELSLRDQEKQSKLNFVYTENDYTNPISNDDDYRTPLPFQTRNYEVSGLSLGQGRDRLKFYEAEEACVAASAIAYECSPTAGIVQKRLIGHERTRYRRDDLSGPLAFGFAEALALPYESYKLAITPGLLEQTYGERLTERVIVEEGRYIRFEAGGDWWIPSGTMFYSPGGQDTPTEERAAARAHFYLPRRYRSPFHADSAKAETHVAYDKYDLIVVETCDALGNRIAVQDNDYRVVQPTLVSEPNGNRSAVVFDALGMAAATAIMGKTGEALKRGDSLDGFVPDLTENQIIGYMSQPLAEPHVLLARATTRLIYDPFAYYRTRNEPTPQPAVVSTLARETHDADLAPGGRADVRQSFMYSDGFGREIQAKVQAEPGPVPMRDATTGRIIVTDGQPVMTDGAAARWSGSSWTIFNNKGNPVRKYEPFFTDTHRFESDARIGISPVLIYDPIGRVVATLHPNHTWEKVQFDAWRQRTWNANDTVLIADPRLDADVGGFFRRLTDDLYMPSWYERRIGGGMGLYEQDAARKAAEHADTPSTVYFDSLGRSYLAVACNKYKRSDAPAEEPPIEVYYRTRNVYDIEGNRREAIDAEDRIVMRCTYDLLGTALYQDNMESGERWTLYDIAGKPVRSWNVRGYESRNVYDALQRPIATYVREGDSSEKLVGRTVYGESWPNAALRNLLGKTVQTYDQAGVVTSDEYDFKGNSLSSRRQLAQEYKATLNWSGDVPLEERIHASHTVYDALNRPTELTSPDSSVIRLGYNEASLLEAVKANVRGERTADGQPVWTSFVDRIDYDAKGQRTKIEYGNGTVTTYGYDRWTYRLSHMATRRETTRFPEDCPQLPPPGWPGCGLQNLRYTYDAAGNVTHIQDDAQQTVYFRNKRVEPGADYTYDALGRLIEASGREHLGQTQDQQNSPAAPDAFGDFHSRLAQAGNGNAMGTYIERYAYDAAGNLLTMQHRGNDPASPGWTRHGAYADDSNKLLSAGQFLDQEHYEYDVHGNMTRMSHLSAMQWDFRDQLQATARQAVGGGGTPETTWYVYDAAGIRVRKVTERHAAAGVASTRMKERVYLGIFEIYREYGGDGRTIDLERETLHIQDDRKRIALVETRTLGTDRAPQQLVRFQFGNHLGSASLDLDQEGQIISYEEYYPYGSTSYQAVRSQTETPKRYRYSGKERDEENGMYYNGARYYSPQLCRWINPDPAGIQDGMNQYVAFHNNPVLYVDPSGLTAEPTNIIAEVLDLKTGYQHMKTLGQYTEKEIGLALDLKTNRLLLLEGGDSINFGNFVQLGHTHTSLGDLNANPSNADILQMQSRNILEHWIYGEKGGWGRIVYNQANSSYEYTRYNEGQVIQYEITANKEAHLYEDPLVREKASFKFSKPVPVNDTQFEKQVAYLEGVMEKKNSTPPASGLQSSPGEQPKFPAGETLKGAAEIELPKGTAPGKSSLTTTVTSVAKRYGPALGHAVGALATAYEVHQIATATAATASEQGGLMGVAQAGKSGAKSLASSLWFIGGAALAVAIVAASGGVGAPIAVGIVAATIGSTVAIGGTKATHDLIDYVTPGLR